MGKWLSFIVPVYNAERYLAECVESMLHQDIPTEQYEIILYDDGSTDKSLEIARNYERQYPCVRVFTHENAGATATRNAGLRQAQGDYVWFVDSDDKVVENVLSAMRETIISMDLDVLVFNASRFNEDGRWNITRFRGSQVITGQQFFLKNHCNVEPWNKIFRRTLLIENELFFELRIAEDSEWLPRCFYNANRVKVIQLHGYCNRVAKGSVSRSGNQERWSEYNLMCLESHIDYMAGRRAARYWLRVLVLDVRLTFWGMTMFPVRTEFRNSVLDRMGGILRKALKILPIVPCADYLVLWASAMNPRFVFDLQRKLRSLKKSH